MGEEDIYLGSWVGPCVSAVTQNAGNCNMSCLYLLHMQLAREIFSKFTITAFQIYLNYLDREFCMMYLLLCRVPYWATSSTGMMLFALI